MASSPEIPFDYSYSAVIQRLKISAHSSRQEAEYWRRQAAILSEQGEWFKSAYTLLVPQYNTENQQNVQLQQTAQRQQHQIRLLEQELARTSQANHDVLATENQESTMPYLGPRAGLPQTTSHILLGSVAQGTESQLQASLEPTKRRAGSSHESERSPKSRNWPGVTKAEAYGLAPIGAMQLAKDGENCVEWAAGGSMGSGILSS